MAHRLIELAEAEGSPIIERDQATFVWKGANPPKLMGDFTDWERGEPLELEESGENIWSLGIEFPTDAYLEYVFLRGKSRVLDPFNRRLTPNGLGRYNHYFSMPSYKPTKLTTRQAGIPSGRVFKHSVPTWRLVGGNKRKVHFYQPPISEPTPLVVVLDGQDYLQRANLPIIVDNLIALKRIQPISMALVENNVKTRIVEYTCSESTVYFLSEIVLILASEKLNILDISASPGTFGIIGASMGGLMALYTALRHPEIFGKVLTQSGGFSMDNHDSIVFDLLKNSAKKSLRIWMEVGKYDFLNLLDANRRLNDLLQGCGYEVTYREYNAGHNYPAWRDEIWRGLELLFGI